MAKEKIQAGAKALAMRPIVPDDEPFLFDVFASTRAEELKLLPWDEAQKEAFLKQQFAAQRDHYFQHYPDAQYQIILQDERPVGRLYVHRRENEIRILDITILPQYRSAGLGTPLVKEIMNEGERSGRAVSIYVDNFSPAIRLFERLGFSKIEEDGINVLFKWNPLA
ncbi:MAG: GNAT family N-acetyltransferase [Pyrinomonadaceae bacterium]